MLRGIYAVIDYCDVAESGSLIEPTRKTSRFRTPQRPSRLSQSMDDVGWCMVVAFADQRVS